MTRLLIIGWGNPLREDDAAGFLAAERTGGIAVQQLTPDLAYDLANVAEAIFIDADSRLAPGTWTVETASADPAAEASTHACAPGTLLALATKLYGRAPDARLIRIGAASFGDAEGPTPKVAVAVDEVVAYVSAYATAGEGSTLG